MPHLYIHTPESDDVLTAGWLGGVDEDTLLRNANKVVAALPYPTKPMSMSTMIRRVRALKLYRTREYISLAMSRRNTTAGGMPRLKRASRSTAARLAGVGKGNDPVHFREADADALLAVVLTPPRDGAPGMAVREIALEIRENARCRIDREGAREWARQWLAGGKGPQAKAIAAQLSLAAINAGRREHNLPVFEIS